MKRSTTTAAILFLMLMGISSCSREASTSEGSLQLQIQTEEISVQTKSKISDYTVLPSGADFNAEIINSIGQSVWKGKVSEWSEKTPLACGDYSISASYGNIENEGADLPFLKGSTNFTITGAKTTQVNVNTALANCIVLVSFTESFCNYFPSFEITLTSAAGNEFKFDHQSTIKGIFIDPYKFSLSGKMTSQAGVESTLTPKTYDSLESATCYQLVVDASSTGGLKISINFNDEVQTIDLGNIEIK